MCDPIELELIHFAPLIQFLAAIYLACLYDDILKKIPVGEHINQFNAQIDGFLLKHQGNISENNPLRSSGSSLSVNWQKTELQKIKRIFIMSASFCIFLLCYIGCHHYNIRYDLVFNNGIVVVGIIVLVYIILCFFSNRQKNFLNPFFWIVSYLILFHFSRGIELWLSPKIMPTTFVVAFSIKVVALFGFLTMGIKTYQYHRKVKKCKRNLSTLDDDLKIIIDLRLGRDNRLDQASASAKAAITSNLSGDSQPTNYDNAIRNLIEDESKKIQSIIEQKNYLKSFWEFCKVRLKHNTQ